MYDIRDRLRYIFFFISRFDSFTPGFKTSKNPT